jgi:hypothetical protein
VTSTKRYSRAPGVLWRLGPDRVLVRRVGEGAEGARDLFGAAALVWLALDEPLTGSDLLLDDRLPGATSEQLSEAIELLATAGLVVAST